MKQQLALIDEPRVWRLDRATIETGRKGIAEARAVLRQAIERAQQDDEVAA